MDSNSEYIISKFQKLQADADCIFDSEGLKYKFLREEYFLKSFNPFYESLEEEIRSLPKDKLVTSEIDSWIDVLDYRIKKAIGKPGRNEIRSIFLTYRKKLKKKLLEIKLSLIDSTVRISTEYKTQGEDSLTFKDIFVPKEWKPYIDALHRVDSPMISISYEFIGIPQKHKGVVCSWIKELQTKGIITMKYNRQQLAEILNREISNLNLGKDGKTFDNISIIYESEYKTALLKLTGLLP